MKARGIIGLWTIAGMVALAQPGVSQAQTPVPAASANARDGSHDFDFVIGKWKAHLKKLDKPLSGSTTWKEFDGTISAIKVWDGKANFDQFEVDNTSLDLHIRGLTMRIYNPDSHQWSLYWATAAGAPIGVPTVGEWKDGKGEFYDQEEWHGRVILVRFEWSAVTATSAHFEQSFSTDGGKTWEVNWISDQTRV